MGTTVGTAEQVFEVLSQILPVSVPCHLIDTWRNIRVDSHIGRPQASEVDVMQQCSELLPCPFVLIGAHGPARLARHARRCVRDVSNCPWSPRPTPFPPPPPRPVPRPCSAASPVLRGCLTSRARACQACGLGLP